MGGCVSAQPLPEAVSLDYERFYEHKPEYNWGYCEREGKRHRNEDQAVFHEFTMKLGTEEHTCKIWGVFDGHQDFDCALYSAKHFPELLEDNLVEVETWEDVEAIFDRCFTEFDNTVINVPGGNTVLIFCNIGDHYWMAHAGDSRGLVYSSSSNDVFFSTTDHSPKNDIPRIKQCCEEHPELLGDMWKVPGSPERNKIPVVVQNKVCGRIGCARGFGDWSLEFEGYQVKPFLSAQPDVWHTDNLIHGFVVLAADGVWDVINVDEIPDLIEQCCDPQEAAERIITEAVDVRKSLDDCTVFVVPVDGNVTFCDDASSDESEYGLTI